MFISFAIVSRFFYTLIAEIRKMIISSLDIMMGKQMIAKEAIINVFVF